MRHKRKSEGEIESERDAGWGGRERSSELVDKWERSAGSATESYCQAKEGLQEANSAVGLYQLFPGATSPAAWAVKWMFGFWHGGIQNGFCSRIHLTRGSVLWECRHQQQSKVTAERWAKNSWACTSSTCNDGFSMTAVNSLDCVWEPASAFVFLCCLWMCARQDECSHVKDRCRSQHHGYGN